jgi:hypothetical protein
MRAPRIILMPLEAHDVFFDLAFQYYVAGRTAFWLGLSTVPGNILHHAIEMGLKAVLSKWGWELGQLRNLNHRLSETWEKFKLCSGDKALGRFDGTVESLDEFEYLRYPDSVMKHGMRVRLELSRSTAPRSVPSTPARPEPEYALYVDEIDDLFASICGPERDLKTFAKTPTTAEFLKRGNPRGSEYG